MTSTCLRVFASLLLLKYGKGKCNIPISTQGQGYIDWVHTTTPIMQEDISGQGEHRSATGIRPLIVGQAQVVQLDILLLAVGGGRESERVSVYMGRRALFSNLPQLI